MFKLLTNHRIQLPLFSPAESSGGGPSMEDTALSVDEAIDFLGDDDNEEDVINLDEKGKKTDDKKTDDKKDEKKGKADTKGDEDTDESDDTEEEDDEKDELAELEAELEEPDEDKLELVTPVRRREILAKYPNLFKEFPYLEKAYYREQQYTEIFPTLDDAKTAIEKSETLDNFEQDVMSGNLTTILQTVKDSNPNTFLRIADGWLNTLSQVDEKAYFHVLGNIGKMTIAGMVREAKRSGNEELGKAAHILNQFMFGTSDYTPPSHLAKEEREEDNTREKQISDRERQFVTQQFESARDDLNTRVNNAFVKTIDQNLDPRESMTAYVKKNATREAMDLLDRLINQDTRFRTLVDKLWDRAFQSNFSRKSLDDIRSAYTAKGKSLLPAVIKKARNEALRGMGKRVREDSSEERPSRKGPVPGGRPSSQNSKGGKITEAKDIPKGMSTLEFLNSD